jgi:hypothetical protein
MKIGKLEPVPLRELWKHEERGFSAWLAENLQTLADTLGLRLSDAQRAVTAGAFTVDLVAEDDSSGRVIIENQLEATDHDHLGKILTYLTNLDAKTAIWITKNPIILFSSNSCISNSRLNARPLVHSYCWP